MPTILACTDGSKYAESIYDHTAWAAKRMGASVTVLHMLDPHHEKPIRSDNTGAIGLGVKSHLLDEIVALEGEAARIAQRRGRALLEVARAHLAEAGVGEIRTEQRHGALPDLIEQLEADADLVVLGKRGESAEFDSPHLGKNLERVVRGCHHPVLLAPRAAKPIKSFLLAFDGEANAQKAVAYACDNPLLKGLQCRLVHVGVPHAKEQAKLDDAAQRLRAAGYEPIVETPHGKPSEVISEKVEEASIDFLVMGAYKHAHWQHYLVGSTTTDLIRRCKQVPVLLFR
ncbi:MAG: universal stress protein [Opitutales bacterium]